MKFCIIFAICVNYFAAPHFAGRFMDMEMPPTGDGMNIVSSPAAFQKMQFAVSKLIF